MGQIDAQETKDKIDPYNAQINYQETQFEQEFDPADRPCVYPHHSFAKYVYPENTFFKSIYGSELNSGGQTFEADWNNVCTTNYLGQCENRARQSLFQVKWMKDGKKVVSSSNQGQIIVWNAQNLDFISGCDVHGARVQAMCWSNY